MSTTTQRYECSVCEHVVNDVDEMGADFCGDGDGGEVWSNWICPKCGYWHSSLKDWIRLDPE